MCQFVGLSDIATSNVEHKFSETVLTKLFLGGDGNHDLFCLQLNAQSHYSIVSYTHFLHILQGRRWQKYNVMQ